MKRAGWFFGLCYNLVLMGVLLVFLPRIIQRRLSGDSSRFNFQALLGEDIQPLDKGNRELVWVHAVSLGETKAVAPLVEKLRSTFDNPYIVISSITATGHAEAKRSMPWADRHLYLPLDFSWVMRRMLTRIRPDVVIVTETDYWYHFLSTAHELGARLYVVNGKLSERSAKRFARFSSLSHRMFGLFECICVQSEEYRQRFLAIGVPEDRLVVTGNLKFDASLPVMSDDAKASFRKKLGLNPNDRIITAGSTHNPEEQLILDAIRPLLDANPAVKLLVVPRHPERFNEVYTILKTQGVPCARVSSDTPLPATARVILVDAMGVLKECYQVSELAIVAGSFTEAVGGHNILEPCHYGVPLIFGPQMHSQPELERLVLNAQAGIQTSAQELGRTLETLLHDMHKRQDLSARGNALIQANRGAVQRTLNAL